MKNFFLSYKNPFTVVVTLIIASGILVYGKMQTALFPEITFPKIKIIADAGLQPVDKMMVTVTKPLENAIKQVPGLSDIRSSTSRGSCEISAFMDWGDNIDLDKQRIESKINEIKNDLPPETQITVEKMNPSILPVMGYILESNTKSAIELRQLANYTIKPYLSQVAGVSEVRIIGGKPKEYWVVLNKEKMAALAITPDGLATAMSQTNFIKSNGYLSDYHYLYLTITDASVHSINDMNNIVLRNDGKRIVHLGDIAEVRIHEGLEYVKINANGREGLLVAVLKQPAANLISVSNEIKDRVESLKKILPANVTMKPYYVQADFVSDSVKSVTDSIWTGLALAIIVVVLFLRSLKASVVVLATIPVTLCLTLVVLYTAGYTFNIMTLGAIAASIGLIIDDAIVVVEQIHRTHEEHPGEDAGSLVQKAIKYLLPAMVGSSVSTIVIFLPFILMTGVAGAYFKVMTNTMIITLVCSFFVSWICLPVIYLVFSRKKPIPVIPKNHETKPQQWVSFFIRRPWLSLLFIAGLISVFYFVLPQLQTGFLPEMDEGSIVFDYNSPPGTSLEETDRMLREVEKIIVSIPEVDAYSRRTGTQMGFYITEPNRGDYLIQLKKDRKRTTEEVISDLRKRVEATQPALRIDFGQVIMDMLGDLMTSTQPIEVKIFGEDQGQLRELSSKVADIVTGIPGTADVFNGVVIAGPSIRIVPDYLKLGQFGITPASFQYQLQLSLEGNILGSMPEREQMTNIRAVYPGNTQLGVTDFDKMQLFLPNGQLTPINKLANVYIDSGEAEIQRENLQSIGAVTARLEGRDLGNTMRDIKHAVANLSLPLGYHIEYGGNFAEQQQSFQELFMILIISTLLVFGVILFLFRDFRVALLIVVLAALGMSGSYLALYFTHTPLNVGSYTGIIMIVGIIGENAIFTFLQFRQAALLKPVDEAIIYSISTRLRPKLMTSLGAIIALMPLALGIGAGAQLHQPLAISVIGGFIMALPLLLIVLPSMLRLLFKHRGQAI